MAQLATKFAFPFGGNAIIVSPHPYTSFSAFGFPPGPRLVHGPRYVRGIDRIVSVQVSVR